MLSFLLRRGGTSLLMVLLVSILVFSLAHLSGDPARLMLGTDTTLEQIAELRRELGLDRPLLTQYLDFLGSALRGDLGMSLYYRQDTLSLVLERLPATIELSSLAMALALLVAIPAGIFSALRQNSWIDYANRFVTLLGQSMPAYWIGVMLILLFAVELNLLPAGGRGSFSHVVLPAITLGLWPMARISRVLRASMIEELPQTYVKMAYSKGLSARSVVLWHVVRNSLIPVTNVAALTFGTILGGTVITEFVFSWPGVGRLGLEAVTQRDFPLVQAIVLVSAVIFVLINFIVDVVTFWLDPRIRVS